MRKSVAVSLLLSVCFTIVLTVICCLLSQQILSWMKIPADISKEAYAYMFVVLLEYRRNRILQHNLKHPQSTWRQQNTFVFSGVFLCFKYYSGHFVYSSVPHGRGRSSLGHNLFSVSFSCTVSSCRSKEFSCLAFAQRGFFRPEGGDSPLFPCNCRTFWGNRIHSGMHCKPLGLVWCLCIADSLLL